MELNPALKAALAKSFEKYPFSPRIGSGKNALPRKNAKGKQSHASSTKPGMSGVTPLPVQAAPPNPRSKWKISSVRRPLHPPYVSNSVRRELGSFFLPPVTRKPGAIAKKVWKRNKKALKSSFRSEAEWNAWVQDVFVGKNPTMIRIMAGIEEPVERRPPTLRRRIVVEEKPVAVPRGVVNKEVGQLLRSHGDVLDDYQRYIVSSLSNGIPIEEVALHYRLSITVIGHDYDRALVLLRVAKERAQS